MAAISSLAYWTNSIRKNHSIHHHMTSYLLPRPDVFLLLPSHIAPYSLTEDCQTCMHISMWPFALAFSSVWWVFSPYIYMAHDRTSFKSLITEPLSNNLQFFFLFWLSSTACWILIPWPGIEPGARQWKSNGPPGNFKQFYLKLQLPSLNFPILFSSRFFSLPCTNLF